ncbi:hypothetical protein AB0H83_45255 [Dactylosporangium sp. NPDC050688]|uniref:hypothetical protein n=1 Tax=Dactylosporangium sp. NPDC050688 TaxID=3157217 RepID=UPI0033DCC521
MRWIGDSRIGLGGVPAAETLPVLAIAGVRRHHQHRPRRPRPNSAGLVTADAPLEQTAVAVSGGFSASVHGVVAAPDWDLLIVGRGIAEAVDPAAPARQLVDLVRRRSIKEPDADPTA